MLVENETDDSVWNTLSVRERDYVEKADAAADAETD